MANRHDLLEALDKYKADLISKTKVMPGRVLVKHLRKTLETPRARFNYFVESLPEKYQAIGIGKLGVTWRNCIIYLKSRVSLSNQAILYKFVTAHDDRVRPNHAVLEGLICHRNHWALNTATQRNIVPPLEPNCRCQIVPISIVETAVLLRRKPLSYYLNRKLPAKATGFLYKGL